MKFVIERDELLRPLQIVQGVVERRQALPVLANVLIRLEGDTLALTATDMEVELGATTTLPTDSAQNAVSGETTVPARKLIDICRSLPAGSELAFSVESNKAAIRSGRSRFTLATLPAADYPASEQSTDVLNFSLAQAELKRVIDLTQFAMAHQDVRYYLNGMLWEFGPERLRTVATDGHRLALAEAVVDGVNPDEQLQVVVPRKGIIELNRLLTDSDELVVVEVGKNAIRAEMGAVTFVSKLVDGKFPDYRRVIPERDQCDKEVIADRETFRQSLARASILSNEKYRAIRLSLQNDAIHVAANNPEQEEAEDEIAVEYQGESLEIGFNVSYLMDALATVPTDSVKLFLTDASSSCLVLPRDRDDCQFVVMPMRL